MCSGSKTDFDVGNPEEKVNSDIGRRGNFILNRTDGKIEPYTGYLISETPTHFKIRLLDGRERDLLKTSVQKIEWETGKAFEAEK